MDLTKDSGNEMERILKAIFSKDDDFILFRGMVKFGYRLAQEMGFSWHPKFTVLQSKFDFSDIEILFIGSKVTKFSFECALSSLKS